MPLTVPDPPVSGPEWGRAPEAFPPSSSSDQAPCVPEARLACTSEETRAARRLRYRAFFEECGEVVGSPAEVPRDEDEFDGVYDHFIVLDHSTGQSRPAVVGTYRLLRQKIAERHSGFYTSREFKISVPLPPSSVDSRAAVKSLPPVIKGYLRVGAFIGDGAVTDVAFSTTDCLRGPARRPDREQIPASLHLGPGRRLTSFSARPRPEPGQPPRSYVRRAYADATERPSFPAAERPASP